MNAIAWTYVILAEAVNPGTSLGYLIQLAYTHAKPHWSFAGLVVMGVRLAYFRELLGSLEINPNQSVMLLRDDGSILLRLPFRLNDVGNKLDPGTPFDIALRTGKASVVAFDPIDHVERQFAFHPVGTFPLVVSVCTATTGFFNDPTLWWGVVIAASVAGIALLTWRRRQRAAAERPA